MTSTLQPHGRDRGVGGTARPGLDPDLRIQHEIERLYETGVAHGRTGRTRSVFPVSVDRGQGEVLRELVQGSRAASTLEIGLGLGLSALFICQGLLRAQRDRAHHLVFDPYQTSVYDDAGLLALTRAGVAALVDFVPAASQLALPRLTQYNERFDLAFVDGDHRFDGVFFDLVFIARLLRPRGLLVVDDTWMRPVQLAVSFLVTNLGFEILDRGPEEVVWRPNGAHRARLAVLQSPSTQPLRDWDHFVEFVDPPE